MTWQERVLPEDDGELYMTFLLLRESYAATARHYEADESSVRRRIKKFCTRVPDVRFVPTTPRDHAADVQESLTQAGGTTGTRNEVDLV